MNFSIPQRLAAVRTWTPPVGQAIADGDMKVGLHPYIRTCDAA
jgi:hypothetical protein